MDGNMDTNEKPNKIDITVNDAPEQGAEQAPGAPEPASEQQTEAAQQTEEPAAVEAEPEQTDEPAEELVEESPPAESEAPAAEESAAPTTEPEPAAPEQTTEEQPQIGTEAPLPESPEQTATSAPGDSLNVPIYEHGKSNKWLFIIAGVLVVLAALAAAWFFLANGNKSEDKTTSTTTVKDIQLVRIGDTSGPIDTGSLFPNAVAAQTSSEINFQVYEGLVGYKDQKIVPLLATSWTNPDNNTWIFKIKDGVKFQNGNVLKAADVKTSLDNLAKDEYWGQYTQTIKSVTVSGANEVTIVTSAPDSLLLNRLVYGFVYQTNADKTTSGTGAYTIDAAKSTTENKVALVAFNGYHQGSPKTKTVEYTIYSKPDDMVADLKNKKLDIAYMNSDTEREKAVAASGYSAYTFESSGAYGITMNMLKTGSALQKIAVRQALSQAFDRTVSATASADGSIPSNYVLPKTVVGYDETAKYPNFNVTAAKETLTKAGYTTGVPLTFNYIKGIQDDVLLLKDNLTKAGFTVTFKSYPSPKEFVQDTSAGNYDLFAGSFSSDLGDGLDIFSSLLGSNAQFPSYNDPTFEKMLTEATQAFKPEEHVKKVQEINRYAKDNSLWVPLTVSKTSIYYPKDYAYSLDSVVGVTGMYYWRLGQNTTTNN